MHYNALLFFLGRNFIPEALAMLLVNSIIFSQEELIGFTVGLYTSPNALWLLHIVFY
jgi:hypothetical protein